MMAYVENLEEKNIDQNLRKLVCNYNDVSGYKINIQKFIDILYTADYGAFWVALVVKNLLANERQPGGIWPIESQRLEHDRSESAALNMPANLENSAVATGLEKSQFSFQSQRKALSKNAQTTAQLHSSHTLVK